MSFAHVILLGINIKLLISLPNFNHFLYDIYHLLYFFKKKIVSRTLGSTRIPIIICYICNTYSFIYNIWHLLYNTTIFEKQHEGDHRAGRGGLLGPKKLSFSGQSLGLGGTKSWAEISHHNSQNSAGQSELFGPFSSRTKI